MKPVVLDASAIVALVLLDERSDRVERFVRQAMLGELRLISSEHAKLEVVEAINRAFRRGRLTKEDHAEAVLTVASMPIVYLPLLAPFSAYSNAALEEELSSYDAAYLVLARQEVAALLSLDSSLDRAAKNLGMSA